MTIAGPLGAATGPIILAAQCALGASTALLLVRGAAGRLAAGVSGAFAADVSVPLTLAAPFLIAAPTVGSALGAAGWSAMGAPVIVGAIGAGLALAVGPDDRLDALPGGAQAIWAGTGAVGLLLAAAHGLHFSVGQVMLVTALVVLWLNSPPLPPRRAADEPRGGLLLAAFALAALSGALGLLAPEPWRQSGTVVSLAVGAVVVAAGARLSGPVWALRIGAWTAVLGFLGSAGVMAASHLTRVVAAMASDPTTTRTLDVTRGMGYLAPEACLVLLLPFVPMARARLAPGARRAIGSALVATAAVMAGMRVAGV